MYLQYYNFYFRFRIQGMFLSFRKERSNQIFRRIDRGHAIVGLVSDRRRAGRIFEKRQRSHDLRRFLRSDACSFARRKPPKRSKYFFNHIFYLKTSINVIWFVFQVVDAFRAGDTAKKGTIPASQLRNLLQNFGEGLSTKEVLFLLHLMDVKCSYFIKSHENLHSTCG